MAEHSPTIERARRARPETSAWLMLVTFFFIFCGLVAGAYFVGWRYYTRAMVPMGGALIRVHTPAGVTYQPKGSPRSITPNQPCKLPPTTEFCQTLEQDAHVQAVPDAGYGPVASIKLPDETQIDMWAHPTGADLTLKKYEVSRWTRQRQDVEFAQAAGYARYDIPEKSRLPYADVTYTVAVTDGVSIVMTLGGSYSIDVPRYNKAHPVEMTPDGRPVVAVVAVRQAGKAEVHTPGGVVDVGPGQKVQIDNAKVASDPQPAQWQLIRNGSFLQCKENADVSGCAAWEDYSDRFDRSLSKAEENGKFIVYRGCRPDKPAFNCSLDQTTLLGQFSRGGDQIKSFSKGISQTLDLDISEYRALRFTMRARVIAQSIAQAGIANSECPVTVKFAFKQRNPTTDSESHYICVYRADPSLPQPQNTGDTTFQGVQQSQWFSLEYDLRDFESLRTAYYLQKIYIYGNGHDYISEVTDISLVASQ